MEDALKCTSPMQHASNSTLIIFKLGIARPSQRKFFFTVGAREITEYMYTVLINSRREGQEILHFNLLSPAQVTSLVNYFFLVVCQVDPNRCSDFRLSPSAIGISEKIPVAD